MPWLRSACTALLRNLPGELGSQLWFHCAEDGRDAFVFEFLIEDGGGTQYCIAGGPFLERSEQRVAAAEFSSALQVSEAARALLKSELRLQAAKRRLSSRAGLCGRRSSLLVSDADGSCCCCCRLVGCDGLLVAFHAAALRARLRATSPTPLPPSPPSEFRDTAAMSQQSEAQRLCELTEVPAGWPLATVIDAFAHLAAYRPSQADANRAREAVSFRLVELWASQPEEAEAWLERCRERFAAEINGKATRRERLCVALPRPVAGGVGERSRSLQPPRGPGLVPLGLRGPELQQPLAQRFASSLCRSVRRIISSQAGEGVDDGRQGPAGRDFGQLIETFCFGLLRHGGAPRNSEGQDGGSGPRTDRFENGRRIPRSSAELQTRKKRLRHASMESVKSISLQQVPGFHPILKGHKTEALSPLNPQTYTL
eukprot:s3999_g3.t1